MSAQHKKDNIPSGGGAHVGGAGVVTSETFKLSCLKYDRWTNKTKLGLNNN